MLAAVHAKEWSSRVRLLDIRGRHTRRNSLVNPRPARLFKHYKWRAKMLKNKFTTLTLAAVCAIVITVAALAQTTTGSIVGVITDPGGASVPGAIVTVTNEGTG